MARQARHCYEKALELCPNETESLYRMGALCACTGHYDDSMRYLKKVLRLSPDHESAKTLLSENYSLLGLPGQAIAITPTTAVGSSVLQPRNFPPSVSQKETERLLRLFAGRETGYALQEVDPITGEIKFSFQNSFLNHELLTAHILGSITVCVYPLRSDNTVRYAAISIRLPSRLVKANVKNLGYLGVLKEQAQVNAFSVFRFVRASGCPAYIEDCGGQQYRVWIFFEKFIHFLRAKRYLNILMESMPDMPGNSIIEPIHPTRPVGIGWVEHPVLFPLGIERSTLKRSLFLDGNGKPYGNQLKFLQQIRPAPEILFASKTGGIRNAEPGFVSTEKNRTPAARILLTLCPVIRELVGKAEAGALLRRNEKVILFYTIGLTEDGAEALHRLLEHCPDYNYQKVRSEASRLKSRPVSCVKIRELVPEVSSSMGCSCTFDLRGNKYPSPLLHVNRNLVPASSELIVNEQMSVRDAAYRYINLMAHLEETQRAKTKLEAFLNERFSRKRIESIKIEKTLLRMVEENQTITWRLERT